MAALAIEPPVPFMADIAKLAVSTMASVKVAFPLIMDVIVSDTDVLCVEGFHRGSNQSAWKSNNEKTRTKRSIEQ